MHHSKAPHDHAGTASRPAKGHLLGLAAAGFCLVAIFAACSDDGPTQALPTPSALRAVVSGSAAAAIGPDGRIQLAAPAGGAERELTAAEAVAIASTWTRDYAIMTRAWFERTHGAAIDFKTLASCGRTLYARSAFETPSNIPGPFRRVHGPWWLVTMCDAGGSPSISVAVSAWATDITLEKGKLHFPQIGGNEIVPIGVPAGHVGEYPSAPEVAIELAARQTGRRVSEIPELVTTLPSDGPPQLARWRLTLDRPASVSTRGGTRMTQEIFVSPTEIGAKGLVVSSAAPTQPASVDLEWVPLLVPGERPAAYTARAIHHITKIARRSDATAQVEPISAPENK
jgi:hypothetical protein